MKARSIMGLGLAFLLLTAVDTPVVGEFITSLDVSLNRSNGLYDYQYSLAVDPSSDAAAVAFAVNVGAEANVQALFGPAGWDIGYAPADVVVNWAISDQGSPISPGGSAVFGFSTTLGPLPQDYGVLGFNPVTFELPFNSGRTLGPAVVPEPPASALLGLGLLGVLGYCCFHRKACPRPKKKPVIDGRDDGGRGLCGA